MDEIEMQYPEFRQKLIDFMREIVTQLPELRPKVKFLAGRLGMQGTNGDPTSLLREFRRSVSVEDLKEQLLDLAFTAGRATSSGCTQKQFEHWKYGGDLQTAIEEAIGEEVDAEILWGIRHEGDDAEVLWERRNRDPVSD